MMLAMFSPVEILVVLFVGIVFSAALGIGIYALIRRAARDGARDAARAAAPTSSRD